MQNEKERIVIHWFRRDLRLVDNHGLYEALNSGFPVLALFVFDPDILDDLSDENDRRVSFIYQELKKLKKAFRSVDSDLLVLHQNPLSAFQDLCGNYDIQAVYTNSDYEPFAINRDAKVAGMLRSQGIAFHALKDQVIFEASEVLKADQKPYTVFTPYATKWRAALDSLSLPLYPSEHLLNNMLKIDKGQLPELNQFGFKYQKVEVNTDLPDEELIIAYEKTRNFPGIDQTTKTSVALRFGTISIRRLVTLARTTNQVYLNELIWREFFMMILFHFPKVVHTSFKPAYEHIAWLNNAVDFQKWCRGETGFAMVDAGMRQLNESGWMHNRVRMVCASFLVKHLLVDWRLGEAYFAQKLLDYELASNNGNWQWAAGCGCDAAPYFRVFNPHEQLRKFDPDLIYVKRWIKDYRPGYLPEIIDHAFARNRALECYKKGLYGEK